MLSIIGENLDIDGFVTKTNISGFHKAYKGNPINNVNPRKLKYSYCSIMTSEADSDNIELQIDETVEFLNKYKGNLMHINNTPEIEFATIAFGVHSIIDKNHLAQNFYLKKPLITICAELNIEIELSIYKKDMQTILEKKRNNKL